MFKSVMLAAALSFFALSSAEAVSNGSNIFADDWFKDFNNAFKRLVNKNPENKSRTVIEEAIAIDFKNGQRAVYSDKSGFKLNNTRLAFPLAMTPAQIRYGDVLINRRLPLSQVLEGLQTSKNIKQADLRTLSVSKSNAEVYTSTQSIIESPYVVCKLPSGKVHNFYTQSYESKSTFDKEKNRQSFLNKKTQEFDRDLVSFLNASSATPAQSKVQAKPVAKPRIPAKRTSVKTSVKPVVPVKAPAKVAPRKAQAKPVAKSKTPVKAAPVKTQATASPRKRTVVPAHQGIKKRRTTTREIHRKTLCSEKRNRSKAACCSKKY
ncbi:hypothetical protein QPK87_21245 [Kamptonema cortianum]|nr:hypothetical protein [Kamptonema cortianum]